MCQQNNVLRMYNMTNATAHSFIDNFILPLHVWAVYGAELEMLLYLRLPSSRQRREGIAMYELGDYFDHRSFTTRIDRFIFNDLVLHATASCWTFETEKIDQTSRAFTRYVECANNNDCESVCGWAQFSIERMHSPSSPSRLLSLRYFSTASSGQQSQNTDHCPFTYCSMCTQNTCQN